MRKAYIWLPILFLFCCWAQQGHARSVPAYPTPLHLSTSVIVPCAPGHFKHIGALLECYDQQTVVPDEVVISVSEAHTVPNHLFEEVEKRTWKFKLVVVKSQNKIAAGGNRNIAHDNSKGDLILCQDADDIPHPQRVEIVKYLFEHFLIEHLMHFYLPEHGNFSSYALPDFQYFHKYVTRIDWPRSYRGIIYNPGVCFLREACAGFKWPEYFEQGEDTEFNQIAYQRLKCKAILFADLVQYRLNLSVSADRR